MEHERRVHTHEKADSIEKSEICGKSLKWRNMASHMREVHGTQEKNFHCDQCGQSFKKKIKLEYHLKGHQGIKEYECTICKKAFLAKANCEDHVSKVHKVTKEEAKKLVEKLEVPIVSK